jgi:hypothetical protein
MKKFLLAMTAIPALAIATPAAAQYGYPYQSNSYANVNTGSGMLRAELQAGMQQGTISRREARPLIQRLNALTRLEYQYGRDGMSRREMANLQQRAQSLHQQIRYAGNGRYDRYQQDNRYGNYQVGYDGRGGPYENYGDGYLEPSSSGRGGIVGGIIDSIFGGGGLRAGQRASGNLYGVPYPYQNQFRDGNGYYFRSDGRTIYQIDARSNTVVRAYAMNR